MKRFLTKPNAWFRIILFLAIAGSAMQCQTCQDLKTTDAATYLKVVFFLDSTQTTPISVQLTSRSVQGTAFTDVVNNTFVNLILPSDTTIVTYNLTGTYTDAADASQTFNEDFTINFTRKIRVERPDCGVSEDITLTGFNPEIATNKMQLIRSTLDTSDTNGNIKLFLEQK